MAHGRTRRSTHWEGGAPESFNLSGGTVVGAEFLTAADLDDFAPATLVRIRGFVGAWWATSPTEGNSNLPRLIMCAIRKVSLDTTAAAYVATTANLDDEAYLSGEDILWFGAIEIAPSMVVGNGYVVYQRAAGFAEIDIKAMRKFDSAEERLVVEAQLIVGQVTAVQVTVKANLRMLFKAG